MASMRAKVALCFGAFLSASVLGDAFPAFRATLRSSGMAAERKLPASSTYKVRGTPDLRQGTVERDIGVRGYCAPTAVSNTLMWLGRNGYPRLIPKAANDERAQIELTATLGSPKFMKTLLNGRGTPFDRVYGGAIGYILDKGYTVRRLEKQSPRYLEGAPAGGEHPIDWLKSVIDDKRTVVWWQFRRLRHDAETDTFSLHGGHWVSVVGYVQDRKTPNVEITLIIHDPANAVMQEGQRIHFLRMKERSEGGKPGVEIAGEFIALDRIKHELKDHWAGHYVGGGDNWRPAPLMNVVALEVGPSFDRKVLFNGRDLTGWTAVGASVSSGPRVDPDVWPVREGAIVCGSDTVALLISGGKYGDFDLTFDAKLPRGAATIVLVRSDFFTEGALPIFLLDRAALAKAPPKEIPGPLAVLLTAIAGAMRQDRWNDVGIRCKGNRIRFTINGKEIFDVGPDLIPELRNAPRAGNIVFLSVNGDGAGSAYRNLRIRDLR